MTKKENGNAEQTMTVRFGKEKGYCRDCRHINRGTADFSGGIGLLACKFSTGVSREQLCEIEQDGKWLFEKYDEKNCTWFCNDIVVEDN